jgi:hypothetical protein
MECTDFVYEQMSTGGKIIWAPYKVTVTAEQLAENGVSWSESTAPRTLTSTLQGW